MRSSGPSHSCASIACVLLLITDVRSPTQNRLNRRSITHLHQGLLEIGRRKEFAKAIERQTSGTVPFDELGKVLACLGVALDHADDLFPAEQP